MSFFVPSVHKSYGRKNANLLSKFFTISIHVEHDILHKTFHCALQTILVEVVNTWITDAYHKLKNFVPYFSALNSR